jgi:hypothetical protein
MKEIFLNVFLYKKGAFLEVNEIKEYQKEVCNAYHKYKKYADSDKRILFMYISLNYCMK